MGNAARRRHRRVRQDVAGTWAGRAGPLAHGARVNWAGAARRRRRSRWLGRSRSLSLGRAKSRRRRRSPAMQKGSR
jgi:hypothetical protein